MKTIGIITNTQKDLGLKYTDMLIRSIEKHGGAYITPAKAHICGMEGIDDGVAEICTACDIIICLGGDGTFLKTAKTAYSFGIPILGINLGTLGFLTDIETQEIDKCIECLMNDKYYIEERIMLNANVYKNGQLISSDSAINDVVISREKILRILHLSTYIDGNFIDTFPGDGIVIATPTGSTAYSLSAGGPIVEPNAELMLITPICPHMLYSRSFVASDSRHIKVVLSEDYEHTALVTVDGQRCYEVKGGDYIEVSKSNSTVKIVKIQSKDFFTILRNKIYNRKEV